MSLKYAIIGTGAIGGFFGSKLAYAGKNVHFLLHSDYDFVKINGLQIDSVEGNFHLDHIPVYKDTIDIGTCDVILVCMKTTNNHILAKILPPLLKRETIIIMIQNGLGVESDLTLKLPEVNIAGGLAFICSYKTGPGHIVHLDQGKLVIGGYRISNPETLEKVCSNFKESGVSAEIAPDLNSARWQKLIWNIPFNGMTVVLNTTTDRLVNNINTEQLLTEIMLEVIKGGNACGIKFPIDDSYAQKMIKMTKHMPSYSPSMKLDYDSKREMEIEYIYTRPIREALAHGVEMKQVSMLEKQLRFLDQRL